MELCSSKKNRKIDDFAIIKFDEISENIIDLKDIREKDSSPKVRLKIKDDIESNSIAYGKNIGVLLLI